MNIKDETIDLQTSTGPMRTYVYSPAVPGKFPALLLFSEIFQQTGPIKRAAAMYAGHGFIVAVPEIYHELEPAGTVLAYDQAGADTGNKHKITKTIAAYDDDARMVIKHVKGRSDATGKVGVIGICIGGHLAFRAAMNPDVAATACFYATDIHKASLGQGMKDDSLARIKDIRGELMMIWGRQDPHIPLDGRVTIYNALNAAETNFTWHEFNGAHAFMRDEGPRYDPELALLGYQMALRLFTRKLALSAE